MTSANQQINDLHRAYCSAVGIDLPLNMYRESVWAGWLRAGLSANDIATLVSHHQWLAAHDLPARSLKFRSIIANIDYAEEDLAEIRARRRAPPPQLNRTAVLAATGRIPPDGALEPNTSRPTADFIESALKQLRKAAGIDQ